jgi:hypothetical protein
LDRAIEANSLLAGKIQGISSIRASARPFVISSVLYGPNREFFAALQGIKSGEQGNSRPDQGISRWSAIWRFAVVTTPIVPTDLERFDRQAVIGVQLGGEGRGDAGGCESL